MALWGTSNWKEKFQVPYAANIKSALEFSNCWDNTLLILKSCTWEGQTLNESSSQMIRGHWVNSQTARVSSAGLFSALKTRKSQWLITTHKAKNDCEVNEWGVQAWEKVLLGKKGLPITIYLIFLK